ncbi:MAG: hypothetical protein J6P43_04820 [Succinivibrionaceae bacterium]|nr:hypothetical protein [Succinivibrionaceae bacterium]
MEEVGRMSQNDNDLFFTCALIDYIARKTKNSRADVVNRLGKEQISKIFELAGIYHCDNPDRVCDDFIESAHIETGSFDNIADCGYAVPSYWDIGKVYKRLIKMVAEDKKTDVIDALFEVYNSFISPAIDDYNSSFYYENPLFIFECYKAKKML